jgi:hypothetical protein
MDYYLSEDEHYVVVAFRHGDLLLEGLQEVARDIPLHTAAIVTGFGALSRLHIHYGGTAELPPQDVFTVYEEPMELVSLTGLVASGEVHAHITASNGRETWGGHLEPDTRVAFLTEVVLQRLPLRLVRERDEYGVPRLQHEPFPEHPAASDLD